MTTGTRLIATPMERLGHIIVEAPSVTRRLVRVRVERWSTDILDCEVWCVVDLRRLPERRDWFATPGVACEAASSAFTVANHGTPPLSATTMVRGPIRPRGHLRADEVRGIQL